MIAGAETTLRTALPASEILVGAVLLGVVALLVVPLPPGALDLFLSFSFALSFVIFLTALFSARPTDFNIFPVLLLFATLVRLALNVASTRLILLHGHEGAESAGRVIKAFGEFVVGGNVGVGIIVFLVLVIINFVVITKGAGRIAEVSARFTLDAMPGKQMAIDAELNAGSINDVEARRRRTEIEQQADFYGAMDGASKFVRGDAVAGLIITAINLIGGLALGMIQQDLELAEAASTYSILTVGDGLVSQMPALVVSTAAGLVISRASGRSNFGESLVSQLLGGQLVLNLTAVFMALLGLLPGVPFWAFGTLAALLVYMARRARSDLRKADDKQAAEAKEKEHAESSGESRGMADLLKVDALTLEVGYGLLPLVDQKRGGDIPDRIKKLREELAKELGVVIPPVRAVDNLQLGQGEYVIKLHGIEAGRGEAVPSRLLAIDSVGVGSFPGGVATKEPVFGLPAFWIQKEDKSKAERLGLTIVDPSTVLVTHLADVLRKSASQLIGRDQVHELISYVRQEAPKLVEELVPAQLSLGEVVSVLEALLAEGISIRNLRLVLEALSTTAHRTKDVRQLVEAVRTALFRQITSAATSADGKVHLITLDRQAEHHLRASLSPAGELAPEPDVFQNLVAQLGEHAKKSAEGGHAPCLVVADDLRRPLRELLHPHFDAPVLALKELDRKAQLDVVGTITGIGPHRG